MEKNNLEQRYAIKFFFVKLGESANDTYEKIQKAFGSDSVPHAQVFRGHIGFLHQRETVEDEPLSGRPARLFENKHKHRPCGGFHSSRSTFDNSNDRR
jgi:hypothetical protein